MSIQYISKNHIVSFFICFLFISFKSIGQYKEIQEGHIERNETENMSIGVDSKKNVFHKYIFEVENFEEYIPNYERLASKLKNINHYEEISISKSDKLITVICNEESSKFFIPNLKKLLSEDGFRLYKIQEILLEKSEAE